jgi:hypothetical protein
MEVAVVTAAEEVPPTVPLVAVLEEPALTIQHLVAMVQRIVVQVAMVLQEVQLE